MPVYSPGNAESRRVVLLRFAMLGAAALLSGCTATPQERLHGRWFSESISVRFRPDGTLIYNSASTGMTTGRYYFDGEFRPNAATEPVNNLTMDLVIDGRMQRWPLEVQFLGDERLRLNPVRAARQGRPSDGIRAVVVLSRAHDDKTDVRTAAR